MSSVKREGGAVYMLLVLDIVKDLRIGEFPLYRLEGIVKKAKAVMTIPPLHVACEATA